MPRAIIFAVFFMLPSIAVAQDTWYVPDDFPTIQNAINGSLEGDTIIVRPGTYYENIIFNGQNIVLKSEEGSAKTVIDGGGLDTVVVFESGETLGTIIDGFTIQNGSGVEGGGIRCVNSSPNIINNNIQNNTADETGGIFCTDSSVVIDNNTISGNTSSGIFGAGGISCSGISSFPIITNNTIINNQSYFSGGGIACNCVGTIKNNIISNNLTTLETGTGGGIYIGNGYGVLIENNLICNNTSGEGGGLYLTSCSVTCINNTLYENSATSGGGGMHCYFDATCSVVNSIIGNNDAPIGPEIYLKDFKFGPYPSVLSIDFSNVRGDQSFIEVEPDCTLTWGVDMISADPLFATGPKGNYYLCQFAAGQGATGAESPCLDAGSDLAGNLGMDLYTTRTDGVLDSGIVDIGYHYTPEVHTLYVPDDFLLIQQAIQAASSGDTIIVRPGTYMENINLLGKAIRLQSESGPETTILDGGRAGTAVVFENGEDPITVLEGFTLTNGNATTGGGIYCLDSSPTIIGNTITGNEAVESGGGIYCSNSSPEIRNNTITDNLANTGGGICCNNASPTTVSNHIEANTGVDLGGGIYCTNNSSSLISRNTLTENSSIDGGGIACHDSSPTITHNDIIGNIVSDQGGGIFCLSNAAPWITDNMIIDNSGFSGGGICWKDSSPTLINNRIENNVGSTYGGGICCRDSSSATVKNNLINYNSAEQGGGILIHNSSQIDIFFGTITNNSASYGAGILISTSSPTIMDTIIWNNLGPEIFVISGTPVVSYCDIEGGWSGTGNIDANPRFIDPDNNFLLQQHPCQPGINNPCVDSGSGPVDGLGTTRTDGTHDSGPGNADMGYHYPCSDFFSRLQDRLRR